MIHLRDAHQHHAGILAAGIATLIVLLGLRPPVTASSPPVLPTPNEPVRAQVYVVSDAPFLKQNSRAPRARAAVRHAITTVQIGTYVILADGPTPRIIAARFIMNDADRDYMVKAVSKIVMRPATGLSAYLDEFIEQIDAALVRRFGKGGLRVTVEIFGGSRKVTMAATAATISVIGLGDGLVVTRVVFDHAAIARDSGPGVPSSISRSESSAARQIPSEPAAASGPMMTGPYVCTVLGAGIMVIAIAVRRRRARAAGLQVPQLNPAPEQPAPRALVITEIDNDNTVIRDGESLPLVLGAPVVFGSDQTCTCVVRPIEEFRNGEIFRVTLNAANTICIKAVAGVLCNGKAIPARGTIISSRRSVSVRASNREWHLQVDFDADAASAVDRLFAVHGSEMASAATGATSV